MVKKMAGPGARSATSVAKESGVHQATLSRWLREAGRLRSMSDAENKSQEAEERRPQDWSAREKLQVIVEALSLSDEDLGAFLRRKGLHEAQLREWRETALGALDSRREKKPTKGEARRVRQLERELRRKDKALAETAALLVLKKKAQAIWGDGDGDTESRSGR